MSIFWDSTQRARKSHRCDYCAEWIEPGQLYERRFCSDFRGSLADKLMCEHADPPCPEPYMEMAEPGRPEIEFVVPLELVLENRLVRKVLMNGQVVTETETVTVVREGQPKPMYADLFSGPDSDIEDVAF